MSQFNLGWIPLIAQSLKRYFVSLGSNGRISPTLLGSGTAAPTTFLAGDQAFKVVDWAVVNNKPTTFPPTTHTHTADDLSLTIDWVDVQNKPTTFLPAGHTHVASDLLTVFWARITDKPTTFPPTSHTHVATDILSVFWGNITNKPTTFPPSTHSHLPADLPLASTTQAGIFQLVDSIGIQAKSNVGVFTPNSAVAAQNFVLLSGTTVTPNLNTGINFRYDRSSNGTISNPINGTPGQSGVILLYNSGFSTITFSFGANFRFFGGSPNAQVPAFRYALVSYIVGPSNLIFASYAAAT